MSSSPCGEGVNAISVKTQNGGCFKGQNTYNRASSADPETCPTALMHIVRRQTFLCPSVHLLRLLQVFGKRG
jgi:hypothetical protein